MLFHWWRTLPARSVRAIILGGMTLVLVGAATVVAATQAPLPPDKQAVADRIARDRATAAARATVIARTPGAVQKFAPSTEMRLTEQARPSPTPRTGLLGTFGNNCGLMGGRILIKTLWQDTVDGQWHRVCAGGLIVGRGQEPGQGIVVVRVGQGDGLRPNQYFETPVNAGHVIITAVSTDKRYFTLRAEDGTTFVFDLPSRTFISGPGVVTTGTPAARPPGAPTPTPTPALAATPTPTPRRP